MFPKSLQPDGSSPIYEDAELRRGNQKIFWIKTKNSDTKPIFHLRVFVLGNWTCLKQNNGFVFLCYFYSQKGLCSVFNLILVLTMDMFLSFSAILHCRFGPGNLSATSTSEWSGFLHIKKVFSVFLCVLCGDDVSEVGFHNKCLCISTPSLSSGYFVCGLLR